MATPSGQEKLDKTNTIFAEYKRLQESKQKLIADNGGRREFEYCGEKFVNFQNVYHRSGVNSMALNLPQETVEGARMLEIGCGTGCISVVHYLRNKSKLSYVLATDINRQALENTKVNFERYAVPGDVRYSDVYENIREDEKFDLIFWHTPNLYQPIEKAGQLNILDRSITDPGYEAICRFITEAHGHLRPGGRAVFSYGNHVGFMDVLNEKALKANMRLERIWYEPTVYSEVLFGYAELWQVIPIRADQ